MEPKTNQETPTDQPAEPIEVKTETSSTEIVINSEDGTISTPNAEVAEPVSSSKSVDEPKNVEQQNPMPTEVSSDTEPTPEPSLSEATPTNNDSFENVQPSGEADDVAAQQATQPSPLAIPPQPAKKAGAPKAAVVVAVVVALGLMAVSVLAYMKIQSDKQQPASSENSHQDHATEEASVTDSDVKATSDEIDTELKKVETETDLPAEDNVTDEALGL